VKSIVKWGLKVLLGIIALGVLIIFFGIVVIEPWIGKKIISVLNENSNDYIVKVEKVRVSIISSGVELERVTIRSKQDRNVNGEIGSIRFNGVNLLRSLFKKDIYISEVAIWNINIRGKIAFSKKTKPPIVSPFNICINRVHFDKIYLLIEDISNAQSYTLKDGDLKIYNLQIKKQDTLSYGIIKQFDFIAKELLSVSSDSMNSYSAGGINYSTISNTLVVKNFILQPNYTNYDFTSRYKFQKVRIEAGFSNIHAHNFSAIAYFRYKRLISSYVEIEKMDMKCFRDKRKEFRHVNRATFQDMIYSYPGIISIDSIGILKGNITYTEHAKDANEPGRISFNEIHAKIYKITNDTIYKRENAFFKLKGDALLMGKGKMTILLKGKIYDNNNTFSVNGTLSGMEVIEINPFLEKIAFVYATSGRIDGMKFSFTANNRKASGRMTMLYHGLDVAVKNKRTDDTTALKERVLSLFANMKILNSNPLPGKAVRVGIIDYKRDPEKFLFNYCFKSILSGVGASLTKSPKGKKNP